METATPSAPLRAEAKPPAGPLERVLIRDGSKVHVIPVDDVDFSYTGAMSQANWEIFCHACVLISRKLTLNLGYSHPIEYEAPAGISITVESPTKLSISGSNKELVGQVAANIRGYRPPEPYKGKGIKYAGEYIRRKAGKAAGGKSA